MDKLYRKISFLAVVVLATIVTIYMLSYIVVEPWHILPDIGGDGAKNNFTYLYHSIYGHGYWFEGMNYPYGEHIVYTDGQPILSVLFTHFKNVTPGEALTVLWRLLGLSYILGIIFVYRILIWFKVSPFPAIIFAAAIMICSPQILCLTGHYALGYTCVMPMLFYWTILYHEQVRWRYCAYIFLMGIVMAFLHPYYMAMMLVWVLGYSCGYFIFIKQDLRRKVKHVLPIVLSTVAVFLLVTIVMKSTDPLTDRPQSPFADREMYTTLHEIFTSYYSPAWRRAIDMGIVQRVSIGGEGFAYIGFVTAITVLVSLIIYIVRKLRKKGPGVIPNKFSPIWLFVAFVVLILSMGIPFIWHMEWIMDYFSVFKQFRALGRFSWIFYYVITIYSAVTIYGWFTSLVSRQKVFFGYSVLVGALCIWVYEARGYVRFTRALSLDAAYHYDVMFSPGLADWQSFLKEKHFAAQDFQAIILLPFFHVGTEKLWVGDPGWLITLGTRAGLQLHLPIIDVMMSRSSWSIAQNQVKIVGGPFTDKPILRDIKSNKPFLLFTINKDSLAFDQDYLLQASDFIGNFSDGKVYACYPGRIATIDKKYADSVERIVPNMKGADTFIANTGTCYVNHFDDSTAHEHFFGKGAVSYLSREQSTLALIPVSVEKDSVAYEFSCWALLRKDDYKSPEFLLQFLDASGKMLKDVKVETNESVDSHGMWFRASKYFNMPVGCRNVRCILIDKHCNSYIALDEMLLRPSGAMVISRAADGSVMVNNHLFKHIK